MRWYSAGPFILITDIYRLYNNFTLGRYVLRSFIVLHTLNVHSQCCNRKTNHATLFLNCNLKTSSMLIIIHFFLLLKASFNNINIYANNSTIKRNIIIKVHDNRRIIIVQIICLNSFL